MNIRRQVLVCLVVAALVSPVPAYPAGRPAMLGIATSSYQARIGQSELLPGATIFSGDTLFVEQDGIAVVSLSSESVARFGSETSARLLKPENSTGTAIELRSGVMTFRGRAGALEARIGDAVVRGAGDQPAVAAVAYVSPEKVLVGAEEGSVTVSTARNGRSVTLRKGESVEVNLADPPKPQATSPAGAGSAGVAKVAVIGTILAVGITVIALSLRNDGLTRQQQQDLVSPFRLRQ